MNTAGVASTRWRARAARGIWFCLGLAMLALGVIGAFLPVMPTTIFLILAVACFGRSSPAWQARLLAHPRYGPSLRAWREQGAISVRGKRLATLGIAAGLAVFWWGARPTLALGLPVAAAMLGCALWLQARPLPRGQAHGPLSGWILRHPRPVAALLVAACHLGGVAWLWWAAPMVVPDRPEPSRMQVALLPPAAPPLPVAPRLAPQPVPERAESAAPMPPAEAMATPTPAPPSPPQPVIAAQATVAVPADPGRAQARPETPGPASQAAAPPSPSLPPAERLAGVHDPQWEGQVLARLEQFRRFPRQARVRRQQGVVQVRARIDRQGRVLAVRVLAGSGHPLLDEEALATFQRAQPLPPPPPALPDPVELDVPVEFFLR